MWSNLTPYLVSVFDEWNVRMFCFLFNFCFYFFLFNLFISWRPDDLSRSSSDSEKMIQRLNDELQEAQELANSEKHKCRELQGKKTKTFFISYVQFKYPPDQYLEFQFAMKQFILSFV